jgi:hypothetical protein
MFENGNLIKLERRLGGLNIAYDQIAAKIGETREKAIELFKNYGHIPPENVRDNKKIFTKVNYETGTRDIFTQVHLAQYITNFVDQIIGYAQHNIKDFLEKKPKLVVSGDIVLLNGILTYLEKKMALVNVETFETDMFGFHDPNYINIVGQIERIKEKNEKQALLTLNEEQKETLINKLLN